jgi:mRNA interferase YafQ
VKFLIRRTTQFKKDVKHLLRSGKEVEKLMFVVNELAEGRKLAPQYHDHSLKGIYIGKRDCHIEPDWILIYAIEDNELVLYRTGSHAHLFR